ncbi:beta-lactamase family protein [Adhaeribacter swui]|uniref:Beta-lactamase family protein n=1 Tax=Adhaeribacter swui TaxID=2086471 RepID=A0A7G7GAJ7_9BACT|nr:serine hydrolase domain-containing protein [Adhaeribacter swui]QNF34181.1 beta-lactamase family protein [Adhaeribacter swui]
MKKYLLSLLLTCSVVFSYAQKIASPKSGVIFKNAAPETVSMSSERLQRLDNMIREYTSKNYVPGAIAFIARDGKIVYQKATGVNDLDKKTPLSPDAIMRIASQTKALTSLGVMLLFEEGKFLLDDPASKYIPTFKNPKVLEKFNEKDSTYTAVPAKREVTIRHLLTHTSGIGYAGIGSKEAVAIYAKANVTSGIGTPNGKVGDAMNRLGGLPLMHQPGEKFTYGLSTDVLGYLIEVLSGMPLDQFMRTRIFEPLDMQDTYFYLPTNKQNRLANLFTEDAQKNTIKAADRPGLSLDYPKVTNGTYFSGGAGLSSTITDYAKFLQMMLNQGSYNGKQIISPATVRLMTTNQIGDVNQGENNKFGLGFGIITAKGAAKLGVSEGSYEWGGYFGTSYWVDPKEGIVALIYTQKAPNSTGGSLSDKFKAMVYQAITNFKEPRLD